MLSPLLHLERASLGTKPPWVTYGGSHAHTPFIHPSCRAYKQPTPRVTSSSLVFRPARFGCSSVGRAAAFARGNSPARLLGWMIPFPGWHAPRAPTGATVRRASQEISCYPRVFSHLGGVPVSTGYSKGSWRRKRGTGLTGQNYSCQQQQRLLRSGCGLITKNPETL